MKSFKPPLFIAEDGIANKIVPSVYEPGDVRAMVFAEKPATLVFSEVDYPGWQAFIDDKAVPHGLYENTFHAVTVPAGPHWVEFSYRPISFRIGLAISCLTFAMMLVYFFRSQRVKLKRKRTVAGGRKAS